MRLSSGVSSKIGTCPDARRRLSGRDPLRGAREREPSKEEAPSSREMRAILVMGISGRARRAVCRPRSRQRHGERDSMDWPPTGCSLVSPSKCVASIDYIAARGHAHKREIHFPVCGTGHRRARCGMRSCTPSPGPQRSRSFAMDEQAEAAFAGQYVYISEFVCATTAPFFARRWRAARDAYIGRIEVEQVEQQPFSSWDQGFLGDLRAQLKWSKWSRCAADSRDRPVNPERTCSHSQ
jgi:hypothetical protein